MGWILGRIQSSPKDHKNSKLIGLLPIFRNLKKKRSGVDYGKKLLVVFKEIK